MCLEVIVYNNLPLIILLSKEFVKSVIKLSVILVIFLIFTAYSTL